MLGPALRAHGNTSTAAPPWFDVVNGNVILDRLDAPTGIIKLNPEWFRTHRYGHHVEDDGVILCVGKHVFRRVRHLVEPFG